jgi:hypothetical protein
LIALWDKLQYKLPEDTTKCYMFEMISTRNKVIVTPDEDQMYLDKHLYCVAYFSIYLHGARDLTTLQELPPKQLSERYGWKLVPEFISKFVSVEEVIQAARKLDPGKHEGFVITDAHFNRVKVKSPQYL